MNAKQRKIGLRIFYILHAIIWLGLLIFSIEDILFALIFAFFFFVFCYMVWCVIGIVDKDSSVLGMIVMLFFSGVLWIISAMMLNGYMESWTKEDGNKIAAAIESYRSSTGVLPDSLSLLVPEYLSEIPTVRNRLREEHFLYEKLDSINFSLEVDGHLMNAFEYRSDEKKWRTWD